MLKILNLEACNYCHYQSWFRLPALLLWPYQARTTSLTTAILKPFVNDANLVTFSFIPKTCSDKISEKLNNQRGLVLLFSDGKLSQKFKNEKVFFCVEIVKFDRGGGGNFGGNKNDEN